MDVFDSDKGTGLDGGRGGSTVDTFSGTTGIQVTSHTSDGGYSWSYHTSYAGVNLYISSANRLRSGTSGGVAFLNFLMGSTDYTVSADTVALSFPLSRVGVCLNVSPTADTMYRFEYAGSFGDYLLHKLAGGSGSAVATGTSGYGDHTMTIERVGNVINGYLDGVLECTYTDPSPITGVGYPGVYFTSSATDSTGYHLDNFTASGGGGAFEVIETVLVDLAMAGGIQATSLSSSFLSTDQASGVNLQSLAVTLYSGDRGTGVLTNSLATSFVVSTTPFDGDLSTGHEGEWLAAGLTSLDMGAGLTLDVIAASLFGHDLATGVHGVFEFTDGTPFPWSWELGMAIEGTWVAVQFFDADRGTGLPWDDALSTTTIFSGDFGTGIFGSGLSIGHVVTDVFGGDLSSGLDRAFTRATLASFDIGHGLEWTHGILKTIRYHVYANSGDAGPINLSVPVADTAELTWSTTLYRTGVWKFLVRAYDSATGLEESNGDSITVAIRSDWVDVTNMPASPTGMSVIAIKGGVLRVVWAYRSTSVGSRPIGFRVYKGTGGTPDYSTPAATASYLGDIGHYQVNLTGLTPGTAYTIGVRAWNHTAEEQNLRTATATSDATPPSAADAISGHATAESP